MRALIATAVLLLPIAMQADDQPSPKATQPGSAPLLISDTSWNDPRGRTWHVNTTVAGGPREDERFVAFTNTQDKDIAEIRLHVSYCGTKGSKQDAGWMKLKGPFAAHGSFKAKPSLPSGGSIRESFGIPVADHMLITEVVVEDSDGSLYQYASDVGKVLSASISNFCPNY